VTRGTGASLALAHGVKLGLPAAPEELPASADTLILGPGINSEETIVIPGSGHAKARLLAGNANLSLAGKLADGTLLTATFKPTPNRAYRLWLAPYGARRDSFIAGNLQLQAHPDSLRTGFFYIPSDAGAHIYWRKAPLPSTAKPRDRAYRAGFGPLACSVTLDAWLPPQTERTTNPVRPAFTLAQRLGLADTAAQSGVVEIVHGSNDTDLGASADDLPAVLVPSPAGRFTIVDPTMPANNPTGWRILNLNPATGAFNGRFQLKDQAPGTARTIKRTIDFSGTLRQAPAGETDASVAEGFFLLPSLDPTGEASSHEFRLLPVGNQYSGRTNFPPCARGPALRLTRVTPGSAAKSREPGSARLLDLHILAQRRHHLHETKIVLRRRLLVEVQAVWPEMHSVGVKHRLGAVEFA
jgi:hypothetical protein